MVACLPGRDALAIEALPFFEKAGAARTIFGAVIADAGGLILDAALSANAAQGCDAKPVVARTVIQAIRPGAAWPFAREAETDESAFAGICVRARMSFGDRCRGALSAAAVEASTAGNVRWLTISADAGPHEAKISVRVAKEIWTTVEGRITGLAWAERERHDTLVVAADGAIDAGLEVAGVSILAPRRTVAGLVDCVLAHEARSASTAVVATLASVQAADDGPITARGSVETDVLGVAIGGSNRREAGSRFVAVGSEQEGIREAAEVDVIIVQKDVVEIDARLLACESAAEDSVTANHPIALRAQVVIEEIR
jgi:hypothetical protein